MVYVIVGEYRAFLDIGEYHTRRMQKTRGRHLSIEKNGWKHKINIFGWFFARSGSISVSYTLWYLFWSPNKDSSEPILVPKVYSWSEPLQNTSASLQTLFYDHKWCFGLPDTFCYHSKPIGEGVWHYLTQIPSGARHPTMAAGSEPIEKTHHIWRVFCPTII
jgi:hypothetical protein